MAHCEAGVRTRAEASGRPEPHLGRKGEATRRRLLAAAREILERESPVGLTAIAISPNAVLSAPTFYNYFPDIGSLIHARCAEWKVDRKSFWEGKGGAER